MKVQGPPQKSSSELGLIEKVNREIENMKKQQSTLSQQILEMKKLHQDFEWRITKDF
jgi:hypothetical protein